MAWTMWLRNHRAELTKFGTVGGVAFVVDLGLFNLLAYGLDTVLAQDEKVLTSRTISAIAATFVAWVGNRLWAFAHHRRSERGLELSVFFLVNALAFGISFGTLAFSTYLIGLTGPLATNAALIIGIGLGTIARYVGYKKFVFTGVRADDASASRSAE